MTETATDAATLPASADVRPAGPVLSIRDLRVTFRTPNGPVSAVRGIDIDVAAGEAVGVVGESGSGKSVSFLAMMGLLPRSAEVTGSAKIDGVELVGASRRTMNAVRGRRVAMIFQDPLSALNPVHRIGDQIVEMIAAHQHLSKSAMWDRAVELLDVVGIPQPAQRARQYPHEFSGGMRQRVMIAMAIANDPDVLIADEPTTALDVTVQAQILEVIDRIRKELGTAVVLITHDLGVVARVDRPCAGDVRRPGGRARRRAGHLRPPDAPLHVRPAQLAAGRRPPAARPDPRIAAEHAATAERVRVPRPVHVRDRGVRRAPARARPDRTERVRVHPRRGAGAAAMNEPVLRVTDLVKHFGIRSSTGMRVVRKTVQAVSGVSFEVAHGQTLGLVGESGSGKTTVGRCVLRLVEPTAGSIVFQGRELIGARHAASCATCARACRSCSRTRTHRSIRSSPSAPRSRSR